MTLPGLTLMELIKARDMLERHAELAADHGDYAHAEHLRSEAAKHRIAADEMMLQDNRRAA